MPAQDACAQSMEGAEPLHSLDGAPYQRADAFLHLARRFVGEGNRENLARPGLARGEDMREPRGQHTGLTRTCACEHQDRTFESKHRFSLFGIQAAQIRRLRGRRAWLRRRLKRTL